MNTQSTCFVFRLQNHKRDCQPRRRRDHQKQVMTHRLIHTAAHLDIICAQHFSKRHSCLQKVLLRLILEPPLKIFLRPIYRCIFVSVGVAVKCSTANLNAPNALIPTSYVIPSGSLMTIQCIPGYRIRTTTSAKTFSGPTVTTLACGDDGTWHPNNLLCDRKLLSDHARI